MLLHGSYIFLSTSSLLVNAFHYEVKCTGLIVNCHSYLVMAESERRLNPDHTFVNLHTSNSSNLPSPPVILQPETAQVQGDVAALKKKPTSFQITSVTVQGSRLSTDGGDDSADDLDESHTEDLSSDVLDCSRTTDVDNDPLSEDSSNRVNNLSNAVFIPPQSQVEPPENVPVQPVVTSTPVLGAKSPESLNDADTKGSTIPDQWQHRFKVVKIISSQPFKRGRWLCMDFLDPPSTQTSESKQETPEATAVHSVGSSSGSVAEGICGAQQINNVAHVYEINPNEVYPGGVTVTVSPQPVQQPLYGIFLPLHHQQFPGVTSVPAAFAQDFDTSMQKSACFVNQTMHTQPNLVNPAISTPQPPQSYVPPSGAYEEAPTQLQQSYIPSSQPQAVATTHMPMQVPLTPAETISMQVSQQQQIMTNLQVSSNVAQIPQSSLTPTVQQPQQNIVSISSQNLPQQTMVVTSAVPVVSQMPPTSLQVPGSQPSPSVVMAPSSSVMAPTSSVAIAPPSGVTMTPSSTQTSIPDVVQQAANVEVYVSSSQVIQNHVDTPSQPSVEVQADTSTVKTTEESESAPGGGNTVAIDNKIEQAMDLVKSHLMFAVREEVDVLKEKITELMERISLLEYENSFLRSNATQETLSQLNQSQQLQQQQQQQQQQQLQTQPTSITATQPVYSTHPQQPTL